MAITYEKFMKHAEKVTKNAPGKRPVLKGVVHFVDGSAAVTDSFRLYLVENIHDFKEKTVIASDGKKINLEYPDIHRLIPSHDAEDTVEVNVKSLFKAADAIHAVGKLVTSVPDLYFKDNLVKFNNLQIDILFNMPLKLKNHFYMNALYVLDAMRLFKDAKCDTVTVKVYSPLRPVLFEGANLKVIILPIRKY